MPRRVAVEIFPQASSDIRVQRDYYAVKSGEELARKWIVRVKDSIRSLSEFPERGALVPFQRVTEHRLRRVGVGDFRHHLIFYEYLPDPPRVRVVGVIHGARDVESLIRGE